MNFDTIMIMAASYALGYFTFWIKGRCENSDENEESPLPSNCPYVK